MSLSPAHVAQLKEFVKVLKANPDILHNENLGFFRDYLTSLGATIPEKKQEEAHKFTEEPAHEEKEEKQEEEEQEKEEEKEEEIIEPEDPSVIPPETDAPQSNGDLNAEVSDENREKAQELRGQASELIASGDIEEAIKVLTEAITKHNGSSAPLYSSRGQCYLKLKKPASAIRDASIAIQINPDSAAAYRVRGKAKVLLGQWNDAVSDLKAANQRDYDPDINDALKAVSVKADEFNARQKKRDEQKKRRENKAKPAPSSGGSGAFPNFGNFGGMGGMGGMGGGGGMGGIPADLLTKIMQDPEVLAAMSDPEVMPILGELMKDPTAALKYKDHPKIGKLIAKFGGMFGK